MLPCLAIPAEGFGRSNPFKISSQLLSHSLPKVVDLSPSRITQVLLIIQASFYHPLGMPCCAGSSSHNTERHQCQLHIPTHKFNIGTQATLPSTLHCL